MSTQTMRAVQLREFGGPEVLHVEEVAVPEPRSGEVLVRVHAAGINPPDWYVREGMKVMPAQVRPSVPLPLTPGTDMSGVVEAVGADVDGFSVGDEVFGMLRFPGFDGSTYAEYVTAPAAEIALKPAGLDHLHAAAVPMAGLTAWQFLVDLGHGQPSPFQSFAHQPVPLGPGTAVLVNGAAGGVGHLGVQLARWKGARVIAVASGRHESFLRGLGVEEFIDYTTTRAEDAVGDLDLVLDTVGGPAISRFFRAIKPGGALFPVFFAPYDPAAAAERDITVSGTQVLSDGSQLAELGRLLQAGDVQVALDSTFPLADAAAAHERAAQGHLQGKIVLTVV
ncbi:MAG: NADP-dependent oxidoreductase, partial [Janthinobacterium lividum]